MLKSYFTIAFRNFRRSKIYSLINLSGLAIGFASALVIGLWVYQEWCYDRHFEQADRIYRVGVSFMNVGDMAVGPPQFNAYARDFPEVEKTAGLYGPAPVDIYLGTQYFEEARAFYADSTFFDVFSYEFVQGERASALRQPSTVVLTRPLAEKYFGVASALGKTLLVGDDREPFIVTGVVDSKGLKSHIQPDLWLRFRYRKNTNWLSASIYNYVLLKEGIAPSIFVNRLQEFIKTHVYPTLSISVPYDEWIKNSGAYRFIAMPLTDIYLTSNLKFEPSPVGSKSHVITFGAIAVLIILIAAVNYINMTTARSSVRAREVGIRKTLGSSRGRLRAQFLAESAIMSCIALLLAFALGELFLRVFESVTGLRLLESLFMRPMQILTIFLIALGIGLLAGIYPAFYLTIFDPVKVLRGQVHSRTGRKSRFRSTLVLLQFTIAICLLACTVVAFNQLQFMRTRDLGLRPDNVLIINNAGLLAHQKEAFKQEILGDSGVESASYNRRLPAGSSIWVKTFKTTDMQEGLPMQSFLGDYDMIPTLGFRITAGRSFSKDLASDSTAVILNQSAVQALGLEKPVGALLNDDRHVIGVVADFNFESLRKQIEPAALMLDLDGTRLAIKFKGDKPQEVMKYTESLWKKFNVSEAMHAYFLDESFEKLLQKERILARAVFVFTVLAMLISCLGLFGVSSYMTEQRTKEVGIRKVFGATMTGVV